MALKENYKDDILDVSQNVKRKYQMENNGDGTVSFTDVTEYTQQGDSFCASDMNAVNSEVNEVVNNLGAKNMLPNNATTRTINGITFTVNSDGSVTVNGTASSLASLFLIGSTSAWGSNQYKNCILSGCPSGGSGDSYRIVMQTSSDGSATSKTYLEDGNGVLIDDDNQYCKIYIRIAGGYTANNLIFKPMIRPSRINDDTYAPYAQTNKELTANLNGFKFYPSGTSIVGLISDDSAYTDEDGNYVIWGTETAEQLVEDNPNTYKSVPSEEDLRGKVGADTAKKFGEVSQMIKKTIILTPVYDKSNYKTDIIITTYGMGMIPYTRVQGYYPSEPYINDYFEIRPKSAPLDVPIILKRGKWINGEGLILDTSNGNIDVNMKLGDSAIPQLRYGMFALVDE